MRKSGFRNAGAAVLVLSSVLSVTLPNGAWAYSGGKLDVNVLFTSIDSVTVSGAVDSSQFGTVAFGTTPPAGSHASATTYQFAGSASSASIQDLFATGSGSSGALEYSSQTTNNIMLDVFSNVYGQIPELIPAAQNCVTSARLMMASPGKYTLNVIYELQNPAPFATNAASDGSATQRVGGKSYVYLHPINAQSTGTASPTGQLTSISCVLTAR